MVTKKKKHAPVLVCLKCGSGELDAGERHCAECGHENPHWTPLADRKIPLNQKGSKVKIKSKKKQRRNRVALGKALDQAILVKSAGAFGVRADPGDTELDLVTTMLRGYEKSDDPGIREAACGALSRPIVLRPH